MDSSSSEEKLVSQNNSLDSGFSDDIKMSPGESLPCSSKVKYTGAKNNPEKILQLPSSSGLEKQNKKRKLEEDEPGTSGTFTSQEYLDKMAILYNLREKEKQLKIAIEYEKLRKEQLIFLDTDVLHKKIAECQRLLEEARSKLKMKNVMCVNLQLANTLQRIVGKPKAPHKRNGFPESHRKCIKLLLKSKKDLIRRIAIQRKEVAEMDKAILTLEKHFSANKQAGSEPMADCGLSNAHTNTDNLKELQKLRENNKKFAQRIHLLSGMIQNLIPHTGSRWQNDPELANLMAECEKVSECEFLDVNEINALLMSVCSLKL